MLDWAQDGGSVPPDFVALISGPVFAISVAAYLLVRIDKTLGELRDTQRAAEAVLTRIYDLLEKRSNDPTLPPRDG